MAAAFRAASAHRQLAPTRFCSSLLPGVRVFALTASTPRREQTSACRPELQEYGVCRGVSIARKGAGQRASPIIVGPQIPAACAAPRMLAI
jgi:hypothetical protein